MSKQKKSVRSRYCNTKKPCPTPYVCNYVTNRCLKRGDKHANVVVGALPFNLPVLSKHKRVPWKKSMTQGMHGFNDYATDNMIDSQLNHSKFNIQCPKQGGRFELQAYQKTVQFLVSPQTTINRFLVLDRVGSGKTLIIIAVLNNFYNDPRAKIVIFPTESVANNFYGELMKFPNKYRTHVTNMTGITEAKPDNLGTIKDVLQKKGRFWNSNLVAPIQAVRYTIAGGRSVIRNSGRDTPTLPVFAKGFDGVNPYNDKIVIMDEVHNLIKVKADVKRFQTKIQNLRKALYTARGSVVVGLTATPIVDNIQDGVNLINEIKGEEYKDTPTNEGFVSYFQALPNSIFPIVYPGNPDKIFPRENQITLAGQNLIAYDKKSQDILPLAKLSKYNDLQSWNRFSKLYRTKILKLQTYNNLATWYGFNSKFKQKLEKYPYSYATKLAAIAHDILHDQTKTIVLLHRENGFRAMDTILSAIAADSKHPCAHKCWASLYNSPTLAQIKLLEKFNSQENNEGQLLHVLVLDSKFYSEGVSFFGVRKLILADVPSTYSAYSQSIGRVLRACAYQRQLPPNKRNVELHMWVATHPNPNITTGDQIMLQHLQGDHIQMSAALQQIGNIAVDKEILDPLVDQDDLYDQQRDSPAILKHIIPENVKIVHDGKFKKPKKDKKPSVVDLKKTCRDKGVQGYSNKKKAWLLRHCV